MQFKRIFGEINKYLNLIMKFFLGAIKDVNKSLDDADIFVFSTTKDEGFGIALVEVMGKGIPIIASDVGVPMKCF